MSLSVFFLLFLFAGANEDPYAHNLIADNNYECLLVQDPAHPVDLGSVLSYAIDRNFASIRISPGIWSSSSPVTIDGSRGAVSIRGDSSVTLPVIRASIVLKDVEKVTVQDLILEEPLELDRSQDIVLRGLTFRHSGIRLRGKRCNQPNECTSFNRRIQITDCLFVDSEIGIDAERMEESYIAGNRFTGSGKNSCDRPVVGIELDGSGEDLDRPLEQGHHKGNRIEGNSFEQEFAVGIRIRESYANTVRDNRFNHSFRSIELLEDARYNQVLSSYIGSLSQMPVTSACPGACGIYLGPTARDNVLINNFFEQNFELQFIERNRNRTFFIDESGSRNVIRSDFPRLAQ